MMVDVVKNPTPRQGLSTTKRAYVRPELVEWLNSFGPGFGDWSNGHIRSKVLKRNPQFIYFEKLPLEVQIMIWELAILSFDDSILELNDPTSSKLRVKGYKCLKNNSEMLWVCSSSRDICLRRFTRLFSYDEFFREPRGPRSDSYWYGDYDSDTEEEEENETREGQLAATECMILKDGRPFDPPKACRGTIHVREPRNYVDLRRTTIYMNMRIFCDDSSKVFLSDIPPRLMARDARKVIHLALDIEFMGKPNVSHQYMEQTKDAVRIQYPLLSEIGIAIVILTSKCGLFSLKTLKLIIYCHGIPLQRIDRFQQSFLRRNERKHCGPVAFVDDFDASKYQDSKRFSKAWEEIGHKLRAGTILKTPEEVQSAVQNHRQQLQDEIRADLENYSELKFPEVSVQYGLRRGHLCINSVWSKKWDSE